ncbi:MAG: bifunctional diaminohydroxyphosphoribosylaminopyrimidine deaminase/5-amino-6-(5-phosphoribosylamino)uracil reductase RibD [Desulfovibrio sp.]|jgi:diaminohydroxyphosphoribosylaminopyrimidine deaminase/5-amino-6-(5-phosphoribosylamino)uracil reductase|nr:bifunctional diaminohydroxyphosphoribosylaminopyrimidine deaminase/5-amino-6-(5-phosphoribosylamino)uracil reductase RibD [Desulfovibrio sp.]
MLHALALAAQTRWQTRPNPCVGAVLVKNGVVVARGWHKGAGQAHAEINALDDARRQGVRPADCTLLVTLEPCRHQGRTPPCTDAILASGIRHVVIGALDPDPHAGGGAKLLRARGLQVETGVALDSCLDLIDDFITWQTTNLPYTLIKLAATLDGRIATRTGNSKWITSPETRARVHTLRRHMDALIVGGNTFYLDNPELTCRPDNADAPPGQPLAVVVTSRLPDPESPLHLTRERPDSTIFWTTAAAAASPKAEALRRSGVRVIGLSSRIQNSGRYHSIRAELNLAEGLAYLRKECACHYVLCEGGGRLGLSLLDSGLARELHLHLAPKILGDNDARPLFDGRSPLRIEESLQLRITDAQPSGNDIMLNIRPIRQNGIS